MLRKLPRSAPLTFLIAVLSAFTLASCGGSSGGSVNGSDPANVIDGDDFGVESQGGNPNASTSYFPVNSTDPAISTLRWQYVFPEDTVTSTTDGVTVSIDLSTISVEVANTQPTERLVQYSGPVAFQSAGFSASGRFSSILSQDLTRNDDRTFTRTFDTNILITIFDDELGQIDTEVDLNVDYPAPAEIYLDRSDLNERVGEVFTQQVSATVSGFISIEDDFFGEDIQQIPPSSATLTETYTVTQVLSSLTVQGVTYTDVVSMDYSYNQLNQQTGVLEPTTTTYFLARGIGIVKATNLSQLYGNQLDWELVSTNLTQ